MQKKYSHSLLILLPLLLILGTLPAVAADKAELSSSPAQAKLMPSGYKSPVKASTQEISLAAGLKAREEAIVAKERELARKEQELAGLSKEVEEKYSKIIALQEELKGKLASLNRARDQQFNNLIKVYSAMSASKLAPLLDKMEDAEAVAILRAMKAAEVAKILPKLNQDKAVRISRSLGMM